MITLSRLNKSYTTPTGPIKVLDDLSFKIPDKSIFGIIGHSGSGKSTLIRCLDLLERPSSGRILIDNTDLTSATQDQLRKYRRNIGLIFQNFNLLANRTVWRNIALPLEIAHVSKAAIDKTVNELLSLVELTGRQNHYPSQISGGQKQRTGIARALALNPKYLLCDEATSALDPETTSSILGLLERINKETGLTIIIVTHQMTVIKQICDRVAVLESGRLIEEGTILDIFSKPRHNTTRNFIREIFDHDLPEKFSHLRFSPEHFNGAKLMSKLFLTGKKAEMPVISDIAHNTTADIRLVHGRIDHIRSIPVTSLFIEFSGSSEQLFKTKEYLQKRCIHSEIYGYFN